MLVFAIIKPDDPEWTFYVGNRFGTNVTATLTEKDQTGQLAFVDAKIRDGVRAFSQRQVGGKRCFTKVTIETLTAHGCRYTILQVRRTPGVSDPNALQYIRKVIGLIVGGEVTEVIPGSPIPFSGTTKSPEQAGRLERWRRMTGKPYPTSPASGDGPLL